MEMTDNFDTRQVGSQPIPRILMPLPDHDFDPTEAAIPWKACHSQGWVVSFSTEQGNVAQGDSNKLHGPLPGLISAGKNALIAYQQMSNDPEFLHPIPYKDIDPGQYQALLLPGGDGLRMHQYLDSVLLREKVLQFWKQGKLIGAICHGVLVVARTIDPQTNHSILYGHKVTAPPGSLDRLAYNIDSRFIKHGYIMYSKCVEDEVRDILEDPKDLLSGSFFTSYVVSDGDLVTSRTYMDAQAFGDRFVQELKKRM
jgi:putative intracellular protease/amidase